MASSGGDSYATVTSTISESSSNADVWVSARRQAPLEASSGDGPVPGEAHRVSSSSDSSSSGLASSSSPPRTANPPVPQTTIRPIPVAGAPSGSPSDPAQPHAGLVLSEEEPPPTRTANQAGGANGGTEAHSRLTNVPVLPGYMGSPADRDATRPPRVKPLELHGPPSDGERRRNGGSEADEASDWVAPLSGRFTPMLSPASQRSASSRDARRHRRLIARASADESSLFSGFSAATSMDGPASTYKLAGLEEGQTSAWTGGRGNNNNQGKKTVFSSLSSSSSTTHLETAGLSSCDSDLSNDEPTTPALRRVHVNPLARTSDFPSNRQRTTKYTWLTFVPLMLAMQLRRLAIAYFTLVVVIQLLPIHDWSPVSPITSLLPLLVVLLLNALKEAYEDHRRRTLDSMVNNRTAHVHRGGHILQVKWHEVQVGDVIQLAEEEQAPADMVLVSTSSPHGICFIETSNLDGESNHKMRLAPPTTQNLQNRQDMVLLDHLVVECGTPTMDTTSFRGRFLSSYPHHRGAVEAASREDAVRREYNETPLELVNTIFRGSTVKRTERVCGVVVYTGNDTRIAQNSIAKSRHAPKVTRMEADVDHNIIIVLILAALVVMFSAVVGVVCEEKITEKHPYLSLGSQSLIRNVLFSMAGFLILYNGLIPISLYVSVELVKLVHVYFINTDEAMSFAADDVVPATGFDLSHASSLSPALAGAERDGAAESRRESLAKDDSRGAGGFAAVNADVPRLPRKFSTARSTTGEDLGQVDVVVVDKTGTLTDNKMVLRKCTIAGTVYGQGTTEVARAALEKVDVDVPLFRGPGLDDPQMEEDLRGYHNSNSQFIHEFLMACLLCNTVFPENSQQVHGSAATPPSSSSGAAAGAGIGDGGGKVRRSAVTNSQASLKRDGRDLGTSGRHLHRMHVLSSGGSQMANHPRRPYDHTRVVYHASSPDEMALLRAAADFGYYLRKREGNVATIEIDGRTTEVTILHVFEFSETRKRMSVVVRGADGQLRVYTKGADQVMFPRFRRQVTWMNLTLRHLEGFASEGLRTLVFGMTVVTQESYDDWLVGFTAAHASRTQRAQKVEAATSMLEQELVLLGASAVEDRLQDGAVQTMVSLRRAEIRVWIMTGDKRETALNVAHASGLIANEMSVVNIRTCGGDELILRMRNALSTAPPGRRRRRPLDAASGLPPTGGGIYRYEEEEDDDSSDFDSTESWWSLPSMGGRSARRQELETRPRPVVVVVDGTTLEAALSDDETWAKFVRLSRECAAMVCCRIGPRLKGLVVASLRSQWDATVLAVGDGANDVAMLEAANVGVAIIGQAGMEAELTADYVIPKFRFLERLLLVHGRWSYNRLAKLILFSFYKNFALVLVQLWFQIYSSFSGQTLFDSWALATFNVVWTSVPILCIGVFDKDVSAGACLAFPKLYAENRSGRNFSRSRFLFWIAQGVYESLVLFFLPAFLLSLCGNGEDSLWSLGTTVYACVILAVTLKVALMTHTWNAANTALTVLSVLVWGVFTGLYHGQTLGELHGVFLFLIRQPTSWFVAMIVPVVAMLPYLTAIFLETVLSPTWFFRVREREINDGQVVNGKFGGGLPPEPRLPGESSSASSAAERGAAERRGGGGGARGQATNGAPVRTKERDRNALRKLPAFNILQDGDTVLFRGFHFAHEPGEAKYIVPDPVLDGSFSSELAHETSFLFTDVRMAR